jgi:hypothetical protein
MMSGKVMADPREALKKVPMRKLVAGLKAKLRDTAKK